MTQNTTGTIKPRRRQYLQNISPRKCIRFTWWVVSGVGKFARTQSRMSTLASPPQIKKILPMIFFGESSDLFVRHTSQCTPVPQSQAGHRLSPLCIELFCEFSIRHLSMVITLFIMKTLILDFGYHYFSAFVILAGAKKFLSFSQLCICRVHMFWYIMCCEVGFQISSWVWCLCVYYVLANLCMHVCLRCVLVSCVRTLVCGWGLQAQVCVRLSVCVRARASMCVCKWMFVCVCVCDVADVRYDLFSMCREMINLPTILLCCLKHCTRWWTYTLKYCNRYANHNIVWNWTTICFFFHILV